MKRTLLALILMLPHVAQADTAERLSAALAPMTEDSTAFAEAFEQLRERSHDDFLTRLE